MRSHWLSFSSTPKCDGHSTAFITKQIVIDIILRLILSLPVQSEVEKYWQGSLRMRPKYRCSGYAVQQLNCLSPVLSDFSLSFSIQSMISLFQIRRRKSELISKDQNIQSIFSILFIVYFDVSFKQIGNIRWNDEDMVPGRHESPITFVGSINSICSVAESQWY